MKNQYVSLQDQFLPKRENSFEKTVDKSPETKNANNLLIENKFIAFILNDLNNGFRKKMDIS